MNFKCLSKGLNTCAMRTLYFRRRRLTRGVSRWLSCNDFFSPEIQMTQLAAHHTGTNLHAFALSHACTQFGQRAIRLLLELGPDEGGAVLQRTAAATTGRQGRFLPGLALTAQPFLNRRQADLIRGSDRCLRLLTSFGTRQHTRA